VHCQIESLRRCFPPSIRQILDGLPRTLDETYERILLEIDKEKQVYANQSFQCLAMSIRPLRTEELAEIFAVPPNAESTPDFEVSWRPEDPEAFILSACSTLVTIVKTKDRKIVQFSHFSVKEYLTSDRIVNSAPVSHFQVLPEPAHTLLARACLGVLLQLDYSIDKTMIKGFPLTQYAAMHWVDHACFEDVSSYIRDGMDRLFDKDKPHLAAWLWVYNRDNEFNMNHDGEDMVTDHPEPPDAVPLYYAALCGLYDFVEHLLEVRPEDLNSEGGVWGTPLGAALRKGHLDIARFLLEHGADGEKRGSMGQTALHIASIRGYAGIVRTLIDHGANPNAECDDWDEHINNVTWTPFHAALARGRLEVARVLLEYGTNVNHPGSDGDSPLHIASGCDSDDVRVVRFLLDRGANPSALNDWNETALHHASCSGGPVVVRLLLHHGLEVNARSRIGWHSSHSHSSRSRWRRMGSKGWIPLHYAVRFGGEEVVQLLLDHGADVNSPDRFHWTALHWATFRGRLQVVKTLLGRGANPQARTIDGHTPFGVIKKRPSSQTLPHDPQIMQLLLEHTGESE